MASHTGRTVLALLAAAGLAGAAGFLARQRHEYEPPAEEVPSVWADPARDRQGRS